MSKSDPMTITDMDDERNRWREKPEYDGLICPCGETWFTLEGPRPAVCLDRSGRVTGYSGSFACIACGKKPGERP